METVLIDTHLDDHYFLGKLIGSLLTKMFSSKTRVGKSATFGNHLNSIDIHLFPRKWESKFAKRRHFFINEDRLVTFGNTSSAIYIKICSIFRKINLLLFLFAKRENFLLKPGINQLGIT